jgi:calcineurin-like phosphoesterase family protein
VAKKKGERVMGTSREIWVTSDTHFGHTNIIQYCGRPFANHELMDEKLVENWNSVVKPGDIVYHLGDVWMGNQGYRHLHYLQGRKRLLLGNHDNGKDSELQKVFQKISLWRMLPEFGLLLTHVPVHKSSLYKQGRKGSPDFTLKNIHGHTHNRGEPDGDTENYKCVCVELTDYTPVNIEELRVR